MKPLGPHPYIADLDSGPDHRGRHLCATCRIIGQAGDKRHTLPQTTEPDAQRRAAGDTDENAR